MLVRGIKFLPISFTIKQSVAGALGFTSFSLIYSMTIGQRLFLVQMNYFNWEAASFVDKKSAKHTYCVLMAFVDLVLQRCLKL